MRVASLVRAAAVLLLGFATTAHAEDTRKKWQFGVGFSYWSTDDNIRSNATTAYAPADPSQAGTLPSVLFSDPRPDQNELNEATIKDSFKLDFAATFGLTRWVSVELATSYFQGDVGNIEFYSEDVTVPISLSRTFQDSSGQSIDCNTVDCQAISTQQEIRRKRNGFLPVGTITEVPVTLSGLVRFRPESPFDPYLGGGVGYIFTNLDTSTSRLSSPFLMSASDPSGSNRLLVMKGFDDVQEFTNGLVVQNIRAGPRGLLDYPCQQISVNPSICVSDPNRPAGGTPIAPLTATVEDGREYHLAGGVDYYFNEHVSVYIDGRYVWAQSRVKIRIDRDQEQISAGIKDFGCEDQGLPISGRQGSHICRTLGGEVDVSNKYIVNDTVDDVQDLILIQGGSIHLGGFSLGIGARFTF
jgi:outer membrane protein W